jgi:hypothetical protein
MNTVFSAEGCVSHNGSKSTPVLSADILGDWREEVIERTADDKELRICTTVVPTEHRFYTLLHDPQYRELIALQNVGFRFEQLLDRGRGRQDGLPGGSGLRSRPGSSGTCSENRSLPDERGDRRLSAVPPTGVAGLNVPPPWRDPGPILCPGGRNWRGGMCAQSAHVRDPWRIRRGLRLPGARVCKDLDPTALSRTGH